METSEQTLKVIHPAMFRNNPFGFIVSLVLVLAAVGILILFIWWLKTRAATLTITTKRTIQRAGLLAKHTTEVLHRDVRNVQVSQSALQRMFGVGTLAISSAGQGGVEISFPGARDPEGLRGLIDQHRDL